MAGLFLYIIISFAIGVLLTYSWMRRTVSVISTKFDMSEKQNSQERSRLLAELKASRDVKNDLDNRYNTCRVELAKKQNQVSLLEDQSFQLETKLSQLERNWLSTNKDLTNLSAEKEYLQEKLLSQKEEIASLNERFNKEFRLIANDILKANTTEFAKLHEDKLKNILDPLGENIKSFKEKVESVYEKESQQRFSLENVVRELAAKSDQIGKDAVNLTKALKSQSKTQGRWGEMILENILEKSGLRKNEEYFMEAQLFDNEGNPLRSEMAGKKMRPDALIKYPDERNVILDSKVSLNAFIRYFEAESAEIQSAALADHVASIKDHIRELSAKGYEDYDKSLDFVMMFIPSEPAYIAALQTDPNLWNYAYDKRILLINPTNLIAALKLLVDLWKREYQNRNAKEIAERGEKLYKKFVGFVETLDTVGDHLSKAQNKYDEAYKLLSTGSDNLVRQATKLKELGNMQLKKDLNKDFVERSLDD